MAAVAPNAGMTVKLSGLGTRQTPENVIKLLGAHGFWGTFSYLYVPRGKRGQRSRGTVFVHVIDVEDGVRLLNGWQHGSRVVTAELALKQGVCANLNALAARIQAGTSPEPWLKVSGVLQPLADVASIGMYAKAYASESEDDRKTDCTASTHASELGTVASDAESEVSPTAFSHPAGSRFFSHGQLRAELW